MQNFESWIQQRGATEEAVEKNKQTNKDARCGLEKSSIIFEFIKKDGTNKEWSGGGGGETQKVNKKQQEQ